LCSGDGVWEKIFRREVETPVTPELEVLAEREGWKRLFYTNKLQLQVTCLTFNYAITILVLTVVLFGYEQ